MLYYLPVPYLYDDVMVGDIRHFSHRTRVLQINDDRTGSHLSCPGMKIAELQPEIQGHTDENKLVGNPFIDHLQICLRLSVLNATHLRSRGCT